MKYLVRIKQFLLGLLPKKFLLFLKNQRSLTVIPYNSKFVISDLFPFKTSDGWETHFELLNLPMLIAPFDQQNNEYVVRFVFFDELGNMIFEKKIYNSGCFRKTINIGELLSDSSLNGIGTFACFHENFLSNLVMQDGFLAERGYIGYCNTRMSKVKGYVHGNLDALAMNEDGTLKCLGKSFRFKRHEYRLQHELKGPACYELGFVNTSSSIQKIELEMISDCRPSQVDTKLVPPKGIVWLKYSIAESEKGRVIVRSRLNLPRPVVFRIENNSFDVFHG